VHKRARLDGWTDGRLDIATWLIKERSPRCVELNPIFPQTVSANRGQALQVFISNTISRCAYLRPPACAALVCQTPPRALPGPGSWNRVWSFRLSQLPRVVLCPPVQIPGPTRVRRTPCSVQSAIFKTCRYSCSRRRLSLSTLSRLSPLEWPARHSMPTSLSALLTSSNSCVCRRSVSRSKTPPDRVSSPVYGHEGGAFK
jgi:hypothetical protein